MEAAAHIQDLKLAEAIGAAKEAAHKSHLKLVEAQTQLNLELDHNEMKNVVVQMVDRRLAALEASSAQLLQLHGTSFESLRELHSKVSANIPAPVAMSALEREQRMEAYARTLE